MYIKHTYQTGKCRDAGYVYTSYGRTEDDEDEDYWADENAPETWLTTVGKEWMNEVPDSESLTKISIPGTHDTGTAEASGAYVQCQSWSVAEQLKAGIRYFDIRARRVGSVFAIHHGPYYANL